ncbi:DNA helicase [Actinocatenispora sera]|uniref:DNA 3'-5' helicase n=1 Tax=Actinocatenispora sera TaxID=390989 RepID=A0A810L3A1_9ACTN|nr:DNA helicase [Actinocatenispora sera]
MSHGVHPDRPAAPRVTAPTAEGVLAGLDDDQRAAVTAPAGPLCILAGAGTGKTRAITHRIAHRVLTGEVRPQHVLAVTFTARAAGEMRDRLRALGAGGVQARTFHAAAMRQLRFFAPRLLGGRELPEVLTSKARLINQAAAAARVRAESALRRDLATEIEWAKSSLVEPAEYPVAAARAGRDTPVAPDSMVRVYQAYEQAKQDAGVIDFEDLLRFTVWAIEEHPDVADQVRAQYRHFVVDEYQDVNPVQQRLLAAWLGGRDDLTVVGDASQTIYSFTGASADHLIGFPRRYPGATVVRLTRDYRSTPQVVALANQIIGQARGAQARLRLQLTGQRKPGPAPTIRSFPDETAEAAAVAARCAELVAGGTPSSEIAVLFRTNAQSAAYEDALTDANVPYQVQGSARFFDRPEVRQAMVALRAATRAVEPGTPLRVAIVDALAATGWSADSPPPGGAGRERWEALAALVRLVADFRPPPGEDGGEPTAADALTAFHAELTRRAAAQHAPAVDGVTLASLHAAKGLEWDAVFLVGLVEGTLPVGFARTDDQIEEERRLLYVGITRAREQLWLSWPQARADGGRPRRPSRFLPASTAGAVPSAGVARPERPAAARRRRGTLVLCRICGATLSEATDRKLGRCSDCPSDLDPELYDRLVSWRADVAAQQRIPAYVVFTDATLAALAELRPDAPETLVQIPGIGARKLGLYGKAVLALIDGTEADQAVAMV